MSDNKVTNIKGFRQAPQPTKGEVQKENATLGQQLTQRLQGMQQFFGNLINQLMRQSKTHDQELSQVSMWLASGPVADAAAKGDNLLMDYIGVVVDENGVETKVTLETADGPKEVPDYFDGGAGKLFMLTNLVGGTLIPGFEEQLVGLKAGEGREIVAQFPAEYGVPSLQGKKARFTVYVHEVRRPFVNSPVGELIDQNQRIREEVRAKALADAQAKAVAEKAEREAKAAPAQMDSAPVEATTPAEVSEPTQESTPVEAVVQTAAENSDNTPGAEQTSGS